MAIVVRAVLCRRVITDQETNSVTLVDCVESLTPKQLPARLPRVILATLWERKDATIDGDPTRARVVLRGPDTAETPVIEHELPSLDFKEKQKRLRVNVNLQGVEITRPGVHTVSVETASGEQSWDEGASCSFEVVSPNLQLATSTEPSQEPRT